MTADENACELKRLSAKAACIKKSKDAASEAKCEKESSAGKANVDCIAKAAEMKSKSGSGASTLVMGAALALTGAFLF